MRLWRRKRAAAEEGATVVHDAEGQPVEDPTVEGILPPLEAAGAGAEVAGAAPQFGAPESETAIAEAPAPIVAETEPAPPPEPEPEPPAPPEPEPEPPPASEPEPVAPPPEPEPRPEPTGGPLAPAPPSAVGAPAARGLGRPELLVGAAFAGGIALAIVVRRLGRR